MKKLFLMFLLGILTHFGFSQVVVINHYPHILLFNTYEDFVNNIGADYELLSFNRDLKTIKMLKDGEEKDVKMKDFWGWKFQDKIFRYDATHKNYGALVIQGDVCYYEDGYQWMCALKNKSGVLYSPTYFSLSLDLKSQMYLCSRKELVMFKSINLQTAGIVDCLLLNEGFEARRTCVQQPIDEKK